VVVAVDIDLVRVSGREVIIGGSRLGDLSLKLFSGQSFPKPRVVTETGPLFILMTNFVYGFC